MLLGPRVLRQCPSFQQRFSHGIPNFTRPSITSDACRAWEKFSTENREHNSRIACAMYAVLLSPDKPWYDKKLMLDKMDCAIKDHNLPSRTRVLLQEMRTELRTLAQNNEKNTSATREAQN